MAWQVGTSLWISGPNLRNVIKKNYVIHEHACDEKRNHVIKVINLLIIHGVVTTTNTVCQVFLVFNATSLSHCVHCFQGCTAQTLTGPLWGVVLWFSQWGSCTQTKCPLVQPIQKSTIENINGIPTNAYDHLFLAGL